MLNSSPKEMKRNDPRFVILKSTNSLENNHTKCYGDDKIFNSESQVLNGKISQFSLIVLLSIIDWFYVVNNKNWIDFAQRNEIHFQMYRILNIVCVFFFILGIVFFQCLSWGKITTKYYLKLSDCCKKKFLIIIIKCIYLDFCSMH